MLAKIFLYIFGLIWLIVSIILIFAPEIFRRFSRSVVKIPIWFWGLISIAFAFAFWFSAPSSLVPCLVKVLALLAIWKGAFTLLAPRADLEKTINWWSELSALSYRIWGILLLLVAIYFLLRVV
jgi:small neutral amino acid transporter SnatA (MarC family)